MTKILRNVMAVAALLFATTVGAQEAASVTFDFLSNSYGKTVAKVAADAKLDAYAFGSLTVGQVTILAEKAGNTTYHPSIRETTAEGTKQYMNVVKNNTITFSLEEGCTFKGITVVYTAGVFASKFTFSEGSSTLGGSQGGESGGDTEESWTPASSDCNNVVFTLSASATIASITVSYNKPVVNAINSVSTPSSTVMYNLQGQRVNNAKGIVIMNGKKYIK